MSTYFLSTLNQLQQKQSQQRILDCNCLLLASWPWPKFTYVPALAHLFLWFPNTFAFILKTWRLAAILGMTSLSPPANILNLRSVYHMMDTVPYISYSKMSSTDVHAAICLWFCYTTFPVGCSPDSHLFENKSVPSTRTGPSSPTLVDARQ